MFWLPVLEPEKLLILTCEHCNGLFFSFTKIMYRLFIYRQYIFICVMIWGDSMHSPRAFSHRQKPVSKPEVDPVLAGRWNWAHLWWETSIQAPGSYRPVEDRGWISAGVSTSQWRSVAPRCDRTWSCLSWSVFSKEADLWFLIWLENYENDPFEKNKNPGKYMIITQNLL